MSQDNKIKIRRGLDSALPSPNTEIGELRYSTDAKKLYIDDGVSNVYIGGDVSSFPISTATQIALDEINSALNQANLIYITELNNKVGIHNENPDYTLDVRNEPIITTPITGILSLNNYTLTGVGSYFTTELEQYNFIRNIATGKVYTIEAILNDNEAFCFFDVELDVNGNIDLSLTNFQNQECELLTINQNLFNVNNEFQIKYDQWGRVGYWFNIPDFKTIFLAELNNNDSVQNDIDYIVNLFINSSS